MRYRISGLVHDCIEAKGRPLPTWDRGKWRIGLTVLSAKKPKCPYCKKALYDPIVCNYIEVGEAAYRVEQLQKDITFTTIYISKVDRRKKEFKK